MKKVIRAAMDIYSCFRGRDAKRLKRVDYDVPEAVAVIGHVDYIGYRTTYDGKSELYEHEFAPGSRPLMCVDARGRQLVLLGGRYEFDKDHGIVDKDSKGRKILDPDHGKDLGFMRVRQANPNKVTRRYHDKTGRAEENRRLREAQEKREHGYGFGLARDGYMIPADASEAMKAGYQAGLAEFDRRQNPDFPMKDFPMKDLNPHEGKLRQKDVFAEIRRMGLAVKKTGFDDEIRVAYKSGNAKRDEDSAYYTDDLADALGTARAMVKAWNARHG